MKIFFSWSGKTSQQVAIVFGDWLKDVIQGVDIFMSYDMSKDGIEKGKVGLNKIAKNLEASNFGILFICEDNIGSPWINFEAGALSKNLDDSYVVPFLFNLSRNEFEKNKVPIRQFQSTVVRKDDIEELILTILKAQKNPVDKQIDLKKSVLKAFNNYYDELEENLNNISVSQNENINNDYSCLDDNLRKPIFSKYKPDLYIPLEKNFCDLRTYTNCHTTVFPNVNVVGEVVDRVNFIQDKGYRFNGKNMISVNLRDNLPYDTEARTFTFAIYPTAKPTKKRPMFFFSYGQRNDHKCGDGISNHDKSFGMFWGEPQPKEEIEKKFKGNELRVFFYCEHCKKDRNSKNCDTQGFYNFKKINTWYIISVTYDGDILKVYIDGECIFSEKYILKTTSTPNLNLGGFVHHNEKGAMIAKDLDYTMNGYLREFMMFRDCIGEDDIKTLSKQIKDIVNR